MGVPGSCARRWTSNSTRARNVVTGVVKLLPNSIFRFTTSSIRIKGNNVSHSLGVLLLLSLRDAIFLEQFLPFLR